MAGTERVKQIRVVGPPNSQPVFVAIGNLFYFTPHDDEHGSELWQSDGTDLGTIMVRDILPGPSGSLGNAIFRRSGDTLFFAAMDNVFWDVELWKLERDVTPPVVESGQLEFELAPAVRLRFSEPLHPGTLSAGDLSAVNLSTGQQIAAESVSLADDRIVQFVHAANTPDGNYRFTLASGAVGDFDGNQSTTTFVLQGGETFILSGDANRDRTIDGDDFAILSSRFNLPGTFSQGDFNYDGVTDIGDFAILASKFNTSLPLARVATTARWPARSRSANLDVSGSIWAEIDRPV